MEFSPFWLTRITFSNMDPFTGADCFWSRIWSCWPRVPASVWCSAKKLAARICGLILVLGWAVLEVIADFAVLTEGMNELLVGSSITWGPRFLMAMLGFLLASLVCRLLKKRPLRDRRPGRTSGGAFPLPTRNPAPPGHRVWRGDRRCI